MSGLLLSVIVPVYNAEKYLKECVDSILGQSYKAFELILVDDGSTDGSGRLCDEIQKEDSRVVVVHIENCGIYQARKFGTTIAKGDILTFLDADDWIENDTYDKLMKIYEKYDVDVLLYAYRYNRDGQVIRHQLNDGFYDRNRIENEILPNMIWDERIGGRILDPSLCSKIIKKKFYDKVTELITERVTLGEDALVTYPLMCISNRVYITNEPFYHYRIHDDSCVRNYPVGRIQELQAFQQGIKRLLNLYGEGNDYTFQIECYVRTFIEMMMADWFGISRSADMFRFPYEAVWGYSEIKLYGAGMIGRLYRRVLNLHQIPMVVGWYDKKIDYPTVIDNQEIKPVTDIKDDNDVPILIAVQKEDLAKEIRHELIEFGIEPELVIWKKPMFVG